MMTLIRKGLLFSWSLCLKSPVELVFTNGSLESCRYEATCSLAGAGEQSEECDQDGENRVAGDDDGVGGHALRTSEPEH